MHVSFTRFLAGLAVVGIAMGVVFGVGVATGRAQRPATIAAGPTATGPGAAAASGTAPAGAAGAGPAFGGGFGGGAGGGAPLSGAVESVSATTLAVKTATGETVNATLNAQTTVRRIEVATVQDVKQGDQVIVARDAASIATSVQVVPPGTALGVGPGVRGGATPTGTPAASASVTPTGTPQRRAQPGQ